MTTAKPGRIGPIGPLRPVVQVLWTRLDPDLPAPQREHPGDAGWDLRSRLDVDLEPGQRAVIGTGVAIALPPGYVGLVHPRSGLAARHGFTLVNAPGTIDAGYRGEIAVIGQNTDTESVVRISRGQRIAQLLVQEVCALDLIEVSALPGSDRGGGGFGSTGTH